MESHFLETVRYEANFPRGRCYRSLNKDTKLPNIQLQSDRV